MNVSCKDNATQLECMTQLAADSCNQSLSRVVVGGPIQGKLFLSYL